jgi:hypothetical protein
VLVGASDPPEPAGPIAPDDVIEQNEGHMKAQNKTQSTRIIKTLLLTFILVFVARATPNLNVIPNIPWAEDRSDEFGNADDIGWGNYARMQWIATHPPAGTPTLKPVRPEKFWLQRPRGIEV